ncbi:hypothetical protein LPB136_08350 [Tenacibaculum todarodis]|uniref:Uncharacterized protein n=1 Tax=Tenacibaculum todarodis TaxID=1850252 RepID=A0A1L3JJQ2_9FLAO|nr:hypothetical protein [Tenacibaculum todarodis]APG65361.1 hypothetical protein LPB136_08350 [Tenacibaculum todarodis]
MKKWQKVGLVWGLSMFIFMSFVWPLISGEEITLKKILIGIPIWTIAGFLFGYSQRNNLDKKKN